jgi:hypothetical protein
MTRVAEALNGVPSLLTGLERGPMSDSGIAKLLNFLEERRS